MSRTCPICGTAIRMLRADAIYCCDAHQEAARRRRRHLRSRGLERVEVRMFDGTIKAPAGGGVVAPDMIFVDVETTHLSPRRGVVTSIWAERRRGPALDVMAAAGGLVVVPASDLAAADPEALRIGHYDEERWSREARPWPVVWGGILARVLGWKLPARWVGHNVAFDLAHIDNMHGRYRTTPAPPMTRIDTRHEAIPLHDAGAVRSTRLADLAAHFGLGEQDHSAEGDVRLCVDLFLRLGLYDKEVVRHG